MTLPPAPTQFLAHCKAHKPPTQSQPCKELKIPTHSHHTPADEYLSSLVQRISNKSLLNTQAHPPPYKQTHTTQQHYHYTIQKSHIIK